MSNPTDPSQPSNDSFDFGYSEKKSNDFHSPAVSFIDPAQQRGIRRKQAPAPVTPPAIPPVGVQPVNPYAPQYPVQKKPVNKGLIIALVLIGGLVVLPAVIFVIAIAAAFSSVDLNAYDPGTPSDTNDSSVSTHDYVTSADYQWDRDVDPFTGQPYVEGNLGGVGIEDAWKSGSVWKPAPAGEPQTEDFSEEYVTGTDFLNDTSDNAQGVSVVFSSDPAINCGMDNIRLTKKTVAGCYNPAYGNVLIMYWGVEAPIDVRTLVLFHTYSHFAQHWDNFDIIYTIYKTPDADPQLVARSIEQDASCRIYYGWGNTDFELYDRQLANPCDGIDDWDSTWLEYQFFEAGIYRQDY